MVKRRWHCKPGEQPTELDKRIMYLENKGWEVPTRDLIKTPEQIEGIRRASAVNTGVLDAVGEAIHAGMSTLEIDQICRDYCAKHGATPACLNYGGDEETKPFPMSVCTSINDVVCHGIPKAEDILGWCVSPRSVWRLVWRLQSLGMASTRLARPSRSMQTSTTTAWCATCAAMGWGTTSTKNPRWPTSRSVARACCWCQVWCSPSSP